MSSLMILFRCNSGHFYSGEIWPWDGWSDPRLRAVEELVTRLCADGTAVTMEKLRAAGVAEDVIKRVVIAEFGDPEAVIDGIYPKQVVVKWQVRDLEDLDSQFK